MQFEFNNQLMPQSLVDVEDVGQLAIEATNDEGYYYYLLIRTLLGTATIVSCGPVVPDIDRLPDGYQIRLDRMDYKEDKICKQINFWLNDRSKKLTEAHPITFEEAIDAMRDVKSYLEGYSEDQY